jgi:hypothetical protein
MEEFGKEVRQPDRIVKRLVGNRRAQVRGEPLASGEAISDTELKQALDQWIQFIDDIEERRVEQSSNQTTEQQQNRQLAAQERDNMRTRQADRITREEATEGSDDEVSMGDTLNILSSPSPATSSGVSLGSNTNSARKRRKTADGPTRMADALERWIALKSQDRETAGELDQRRFEHLEDRFDNLKEEMAEIKALLSQLARGRDT